MSKLPSFPFYPADYLSDENVQLMTLEQEGAYIRLMAYCWREGSIPADLASLVKLCKGISEETLAAVIRCFTPSPDDPNRLVHPRLEKERANYEDFLSKRSTAGKKGASIRWRKKESDKKPDNAANVVPLPENGTPMLLPLAENDSPPSPTLSSSPPSLDSKGGARNIETNPQVTPPTLEQVKAYAISHGIPPDCAEAFWNAHQAVGWVDSQNRPIRNWTFSLSKYNASWRANQFQQSNERSPSTRGKVVSRNNNSNATVASQYRVR